jgi:ABC-type sugar transport system substrate-binding protein
MLASTPSWKGAGLCHAALGGFVSCISNALCRKLLDAVERFGLYDINPHRAPRCRDAGGPYVNRIAVRLFLPDAENPYQRCQADEARHLARRLDLDLDVDFADGDFALQVRQIFKATRHDAAPPQVVVVMPVQESALKSLSESTVGLGIGWVFLNRSAGNIDALKKANAKVPTGLVSPDQYEIGRVHARQVRALFTEGAQILYVQGRVTTSSAEARAAGLRDGLTERGPRVEIVSTLDGNWTAKDTEAALTRWVRLMVPARLRIDAIVCQSDFMAIGAIEALHACAARLGNQALLSLPVLGCDGLANVGRRLVDEGRLAATVTVPTTADKALEGIAAFHRHGRALPEETRLTPYGYPDEAALGRRGRTWMSRAVAT